MVRLQSEPILADELTAEIRGDEDGAIALFLGTVRNHNQGRRVLYLEYHTYPEMAVREMQSIEEQVRERFGVSGLTLVHRTGRLEIGEVSVGVAAAAAHRAEALDACRAMIEELKRRVPIWKKEFFEGGEVWIEGTGQSPGPG